MSKCPICGAPLQNNACTYCNYENEVSQPKSNSESIVLVNNTVNHRVTNVNLYYERNVSNKNKMVTLVLCIFFGVFGAHHFYAGNTKKGILYLLTFGLIGIGWMIDIVLILSGTFKDANGLLVKM